METHRSTEDYLEAILMINQEKGHVRSIDIAEQLNVTKPSVSYATKHMRADGYITMDDNGAIKLTDTGTEIAKRIYERHRLLTEFFVHIGVDPETARTDACKIEHDISETTFDAICRHAGKKRTNK